ncbi:DUF2062 domain-containing protein [Sandaracinobacteroides saxicola]|uniref:DUF2062 domain-containing protein n=1 Tax=Sandaracinobacteroides saxicola TaxID=2759707 RepID=A0A7G5IKR3_9SPHN|nr:DUF2062 domain-containing protein [Sandaracinobacteroides saxicola]QMW23955.1 DUF2062 domain-containing protein [Sandaracinobacteroides saxicola]
MMSEPVDAERRWKMKVPSREVLLANRWMRPFAKHLSDPRIWQWNRRSVARGAALGMFITIAVPLPIQILLAALLAVFVRANVPVAALCAFLSNPFTTPAILAGAYWVGNLALAVENRMPVPLLPQSGSWMERALEWVAQASLPIAIGLLIMATVLASVSYVAVHLAWRVRIGRKWARRRAARRKMA